MIPIGCFPFIWVFVLFMGVIGFFQMVCGLGALGSAIWEEFGGLLRIQRFLYAVSFRQCDTRHRERWLRRWFGVTGARRWHAVREATRKEGKRLTPARREERDGYGYCEGDQIRCWDETYYETSVNVTGTFMNDVWIRPSNCSWGYDSQSWRKVRDNPPKPCDWMAAGFWDPVVGPDGLVHDPLVVEREWMESAKVKWDGSVWREYSFVEIRKVQDAITVVQHSLEKRACLEDPDGDYPFTNNYFAYVGEESRNDGKRKVFGAGPASVRRAGYDELLRRWRLQIGEFDRNHLKAAGTTADDEIRKWARIGGWFLEDREEGMRRSSLARFGHVMLDVTERLSCAVNEDSWYGYFGMWYGQDTTKVKSEVVRFGWTVGHAPSEQFFRDAECREYADKYRNHMKTEVEPAGWYMAFVRKALERFPAELEKARMKSSSYGVADAIEYSERKFLAAVAELKEAGVAS